MLLLATFFLVVLAAINWRIGGRGLFYPPVVFSLTWALGLFLIWSSGDFFYHLVPETLLIFMGGALAFSVGAAISFWYPQRIPAKPMAAHSSNRLISLAVLFVFCAMPFGLRWMLHQIAEHPSVNFFGSAGSTMVDERVQATLGYTFFGNLVFLSNMVAVMAFYEKEGHEKRWRLALFLALLLDMMTAGRSLFVNLILAIVCLDWLKNRRIRWKMVISLGLILVILAGTIAFYLGKGEANNQAPVTENIVPIWHGLVLYAAGGAAAFDKVVRDPSLQPHDSQISDFFVWLLNKFGAQLKPPTTTSGYLDIGPNGLVINVYTIYYSYWNGGYPAMMGMTALLGFCVTLCYKRALYGKRIAVMFYSAFFGGLVLSLFAEFYLHALNFLLKLLALVWVVYALPGVWARFKARISRSVETGLAEYQPL